MHARVGRSRLPHALHPTVPSAPVCGLRPQAIGPAARVASPHVTSGDHAFASGVSAPPVTRRFPQISWRLHRRAMRCTGAVGDAKNRADSDSPRALRNPAPSVSAS